MSPEHLEINLGLLGKKPCSNPSSRSFGRKVVMEAEILEYETRAEIERKQHDLELRRKQRELEFQQLQIQKKMMFNLKRKLWS